jgi:hypothetical protein
VKRAASCFESDIEASPLADASSHTGVSYKRLAWKVPRSKQHARWPIGLLVAVVQWGKASADAAGTDT